MKAVMKIKWESFWDKGERFVRETAGNHEAVLGPVTCTLTHFIEDRKLRMQNLIRHDARVAAAYKEQDERRDQALQEFLRGE